MWDVKFEEIMRQYVPFLSHDEELDPDTSLRDLGLDSMGIIEMMAALEGAFDVRFLDEMLNLTTFATARTLWWNMAKMVEPVA